ncbi:hypothetical protein Mapa_001719 [Marchantia paleacea]|nr:hypothetical protein Mapa_001719 [Marchantia paleacea]
MMQTYKEFETSEDRAVQATGASRPMLKRIATGVAVTTGLTLFAAPIAVPALAASLGFQSTGVAVGSWAAGYMASYGGVVSAGSTCAILQSIGATGTFAGAGVTALSGAAVTTSGVVLGVGPGSVVHGARVAVDYTTQGVKTASGAVSNAAAVSAKAVSGAAVFAARGLGSVAGAGLSTAVDGKVSLLRYFYK